MAAQVQDNALTLAQKAAQQNSLARMLCTSQSVEMIQQIFSQQFVPANQVGPINVNPRNVGLVKGFWALVSATVDNTNGKNILALSNFGPSNVFSQITFTDLNNNLRIQTSGWHLAFMNAIKSRRPYGSALITGATPGTANTGYDSPIEYGSNYNVISAPAAIDAGKKGTVSMVYWVPLSYSESDLRGAVYMNVVNAVAQLGFTINPNFLVGVVDDTLAVYSNSDGGAVVTDLTLTVFQSYLDQLPRSQNGGVVLPIQDLSTIYELKNTAFTALVQSQDFPVQYANFRDFLSTIAVFYNGTNRQNGGDVNYWALQSANFTQIWKMPPQLIALRTRNHLSTDMPTGSYYFGSRQKPIATTQYGNMELVLNANTVGAGAYLLIGFEDFALVNALTMAGSLSAS